MNFVPVEFARESPVACTFSLRDERGKVPFSRILVLHAVGEYRSGSRGAPDARLIAGYLQAALTLWRPDAVVLDLRRLAYEWGDDMLTLCRLPEGAEEMPFALAGSALCLPAISTLLYGGQSGRQATEAGFIFDGLDGALAYVDAKLELERQDLARILRGEPEAEPGQPE